MIVIELQLEGDGAWPDMADKEVVELDPNAVLGLAYLSHGTLASAPSLALRFNLPDGRVVFAQTSVKAFLTAAGAIRGRAVRDGLVRYV